MSVNFGESGPAVRSGFEGEYDFCGAFECPVGAHDSRSAEQWARSVFEQAPMPVRWFLLVGWRGVLGLRMGPRHDARHVLGWRIADARPDELTLASDSWLIDAINVVQLHEGRVVWTTCVRYLSRFAPLVWAVVLPMHKVTVSLLLKRAARSGADA